MICVFIYGLALGNLSNITIGWDADGNGCGHTAGYEEYGYLYWNKPPEDYEAFQNMEPAAIRDAVKGLMNKGVCVKACPKAPTDAIECKPTNYMSTQSDCDSTTCKCNMIVDSSGIPFEYGTMTIGLDGTGFCVPVAAKRMDEDDCSPVTCILESMVKSLK